MGWVFVSCGQAIDVLSDETTDGIVAFFREKINGHRVVAVIKPAEFGLWDTEELDLVAAKYKQLYKWSKRILKEGKASIEDQIYFNSLKLELELVSDLTIPKYPRAVIYRLTRTSKKEQMSCNMKFLN